MTRFIFGCFLLVWCIGFTYAQDKKPLSTITAGADKFDVRWLPFEGRCQNVKVYDIDGDGSKDIVIISIDKNSPSKDKMIFVYFQKGKNGFSKSYDKKIVLPESAVALVFGNFTGTKATSIAFLAEDGLYYYPLIDGILSSQPKKLLHTETFLDTPVADDLPIWLEPTDLDGNGLDDIIIPVSTGYKVYMQTSPGKFGKVSYIKLPSTMFAFTTLTGSSFVNIEKGLRQLAVADINGDGRKDLVTVENDTLFIFYQDKDGFFNSNPQMVTIHELSEARKANHANLWFVRFYDINSDGKADLVITRISGELGLMKTLETKVDIFLGDGTGKFRNPDSVIKIPGLSMEPELIDMINNGVKDIIVSSLRTDILNDALKLVVFRSIDITYYSYLFDKSKNSFPESPANTEDIDVRIKDLEFGGLKVVPFMYFRGDYNGDGLKDVATLDGTIFRVRTDRNIPDTSKRWYNSDPYLQVELSKRPDGLEFVDINGDGITDTILVDPPSPIGIILSK